MHTRSPTERILIGVAVFFGLLLGVPVILLITGVIEPGTPASGPSGVTLPAKAAEIVPVVDLSRIIDDYRNNELAADQQYKGRRVQVAGSVRDVKNDLVGNPYVIVALPSQTTHRAVQCMLATSSVDAARSLNLGDHVTVRGTVSQLILLNVLLSECVIER